jgi:hypothetical protein
VRRVPPNRADLLHRRIRPHRQLRLLISSRGVSYRNNTLSIFPFSSNLTKPFFIHHAIYFGGASLHRVTGANKEALSSTINHWQAPSSDPNTSFHIFKKKWPQSLFVSCCVRAVRFVGC